MIRFAITTFPDQTVAERVISDLVEARLAACGTLLPAHSIYHWDGAVQRDTEILAIFKLPAENYARFEQALLERHPYDTPESAAFEPAHVSAAYAQWIMATCESAAS